MFSNDSNSTPIIKPKRRLFEVSSEDILQIPKCTKRIKLSSIRRDKTAIIRESSYKSALSQQVNIRKINKGKEDKNLTSSKKKIKTFKKIKIV